MAITLFSTPDLNLFTSFLPQESRNSPTEGFSVPSSGRQRLSSWVTGREMFSLPGFPPCRVQSTALISWWLGRSGWVLPGRQLGWAGPGKPSTDVSSGAGNPFPSFEALSRHHLLKSGQGPLPLAEKSPDNWSRSQASAGSAVIYFRFHISTTVFVS